MRKCEEEGEKDRHFTNKTDREKVRKIEQRHIKRQRESENGKKRDTDGPSSASASYLASQLHQFVSHSQDFERPSNVGRFVRRANNF